jgi:hypothetical protein
MEIDRKGELGNKVIHQCARVGGYRVSNNISNMHAIAYLNHNYNTTISKTIQAGTLQVSYNHRYNKQLLDVNHKLYTYTSSPFSC